jgi:hypothetical protein
MSQIAPDVPELEHLPEVVRPFIYTQALLRASRSRGTFLIGALIFFMSVGGGAGAGARTFGIPGGVLGGLTGGLLAAYVFFRALIPWRARRIIPIVEREIDWKVEYRELIEGCDQFTRVVDAYKEREARRESRPPS